MALIIWNDIEDVESQELKNTVAESNKSTLEEKALLAIETNKTFYNRTSSTSAQVLAEVKALARQNNGIIRLLLKQLDDIS